MKFLILLFCCFTSTFYCNAQNINEVLKKMNDVLTSKNYLQYETKYNLYKGDSKIVFEFYKGLFKKNSENEIYMKINNTEYINSKLYSIKINHDQKAMIVEGPRKMNSSSFDVNKLLVYCDIESFKDFKTYWEINLTNKKYSSLNYSKIIVRVNKDFTLNKQVFYYNTNIDFSKTRKKQNQTKPRLEIDYSNYNNLEIKKEFFSNNEFFIAKANKIEPTIKYKLYQVVDKRKKLKIN